MNKTRRRPRTGRQVYLEFAVAHAECEQGVHECPRIVEHCIQAVEIVRADTGQGVVCPPQTCHDLTPLGVG